METYKIGNKVNAIIRAYTPGMIGDEEIQYSNQPYTIIKGATAEIIFDDHSKQNGADRGSFYYHNMSNIKELTISDVELTNKILNLIFVKSKTKLAHIVENYDSNAEKQIFINNSADEIYQVFIYNENGNLEKAYGTLSLAEPLIVDEANSNYLIVYSYEKAEAYDLNNYENHYWIVDLEIIGNINDETSKMWVHLGKCGIEVEKRLYFSQRSNAIDLTFKVINDNDSENYITVK